MDEQKKSTYLKHNFILLIHLFDYFNFILFLVSNMIGDD